MVVEPDHAVHVGEIVPVVRDDDHAAVPGSQCRECAPTDVLSRIFIQTGEGFVEQGHASLPSDDPRETDASPFPTRKLGGASRGERFDFENPQRFRDPSLARRAIEPQSRNRHVHVVACGQVLIERKMLFDQGDVAAPGGASIDGDAVDLDASR